jgi:hypothetical protein
MTRNKLLERTKPAKAKRRAVLRWQVFRGPLWCGDVVILEPPPDADLSTFDYLYDGVTPGGDTIGPFQSRGAAAMAIGARAVSR